MNHDALAIVSSLEAVARERQRRCADARLEPRVLAVKAYQHARFERSYPDLLASPRFAAAARFFLDEIYGPRDFSQRDAQFQRIVPALVRLFPGPIVRTVRALAELHALSEELDSAMAERLADAEVDAPAYQAAWKATGRAGDRAHQLQLMLDVGHALDQYTASAFTRHTLRLMRQPARAAALGALQSFLESGFDAFKAMGGSREFLDTICARERDLMDRLFGPDTLP